MIAQKKYSECDEGLDSTADWWRIQLGGGASFKSQGTTAAAVGDDIFVVQPHFADTEPPEILRAMF